MRPRQTSAGNAQFSNMLKVGQELGCQIQPSAANPSILAGLCPFHESKNLHEAKTLSISLENARFWCITCHAAGNPMAFLAKVWGISSQETYEFIQAGYAINSERPKWESQPQSKDQSGAPQAQNTAILTMATKYYKRQMEQSFTALNYLATAGRHARTGSGERLRVLLRGWTPGISGEERGNPGGVGGIIPIPGCNRDGIPQRMPGAVRPGLDRRNHLDAGNNP